MHLSHCAYCQFIQDAFWHVTQRQPEELLPIDHEQFRRFNLTQMQSASSWKILCHARYLADQIVDAQGKIDHKTLGSILRRLPQEMYSLGPKGEQVAADMEQMLVKLQLLHTNLEIEHAVKRVRVPHAQEHANQLIKRALLLPTSAHLSDALARKAALSAWLTPLRQNVGSCFATAPAILIQETQPLQFFSDLAQLFGTGALKRTFQGQEYLVPLTAHAGLGALRFPVEWESLGDNPLQTLAEAPGLVAAFKAAGVIEQNATSCLAIFEKAFSQTDFSFSNITAERLITEVLLSVYEITEQDVAEEKQQQMQLPFLGTGMIHRIGTKKSRACSAYLTAYASATEVFVAQTEHPLLKAWEFTLASFAEVKADISRWNLYISLGMASDNEGGLAARAHQLLQTKINQLNDEVAHFQSMYDHTYAQVKSLEVRARHVATEQDARWIQTEYRVQRAELDRALDRRDEAHHKGRQLASAWQVLSLFYLEKFPMYFQEVYDSGIKEVSVGLYDDMPAGFRLLYKHGRNNPSVWTLLYHAQDYLQALSAFFRTTETELLQKSELQAVQQEMTQLLTEIVLAIREPIFLEQSIQRLAQHYQEPVYKNPLEHLDQIKRTPWSYVSGGTMGTLVSTYFGHATPPSEVKRWVEREVELLVFYLDTLKELPLSVQKKMLANPRSGLLAYSPTHAFILKPSWEPFVQGWQDQTYTYSWVRDHWLMPQENFWQDQWLEPPHQEILQNYMVALFPKGYRHLVVQALKGMSGQRLLPSVWREQVASILSYEKWLKPVYTNILDHIDQLLLEHLPFYVDTQLDNILQAVWDEMEEVDEALKTKLIQLYRKEHHPKHQVIAVNDVQHIVQGLLMLATEKNASDVFYIKSIVKAMRALKLRPPSPILFADPNWEGKTFGFVVSPGTNSLELWTFDALGTSGRPLSAWKPYLDGRVRKDWGVYIKPHEYGIV